MIVGQKLITLLLSDVSILEKKHDIKCILQCFTGKCKTLKRSDSRKHSYKKFPRFATKYLNVWKQCLETILYHRKTFHDFKYLVNSQLTGKCSHEYEHYNNNCVQNKQSKIYMALFDETNRYTVILKSDHINVQRHFNATF